ncbi:MAG TPA: OsmC family protein [Ktedonobacterales bacterium]|nr:OsmC family protein [Ktedonobacterales bacterium]
MPVPTSSSLTMTATWLGEDRFSAQTASGYPIQLDSGHGSMAPQTHATENDSARPNPLLLPGEYGVGACSPMEAILAALLGCVGITVIGILQKKRQRVTGYRLRAVGARASGQPGVFTAIAVEHVIIGHAVARETVERALELAETRYCPVSAMLSKAVAITHGITIEEGASSFQANLLRDPAIGTG